MTECKYTNEQIIEALEIRMPHDAVCREAYDLIQRLLPCKVGDEVWAIRPYRHTKVPVKGKVTEMYYIDESMRLCIVVKGVSRGEWGKMIFPDFESADKYLRGEGNVR